MQQIGHYHDVKAGSGIGLEESAGEVWESDIRQQLSNMCQRTLNSNCETSEPHSYSAHSILQHSRSFASLSSVPWSPTVGWGFPLCSLARSTFPFSVFMIDGSGYSVTTTNDACFPFGSVAANKEGSALPAPSSTTNRSISSKDPCDARAPNLNLSASQQRFGPSRWIPPIESKERIARWP